MSYDKLQTAELTERITQIEGMAQLLALSGVPMDRATTDEHRALKAEIERRQNDSITR